MFYDKIMLFVIIVMDMVGFGGVFLVCIMGVLGNCCGIFVGVGWGFFIVVVL